MWIEGGLYRNYEPRTNALILGDAILGRIESLSFTTWLKKRGEVEREEDRSGGQGKGGPGVDREKPTNAIKSSVIQTARRPSMEGAERRDVTCTSTNRGTQGTIAHPFILSPVSSKQARI